MLDKRTCSRRLDTDFFAEENTGHQGPSGRQGGEGALREDGREDAQEACRATEAEREAQQDVKVLRTADALLYRRPVLL